MRILCLTLALSVLSAGAEGLLFSVPGGITRIESETFLDIPADEIYIPESVGFIGQNAFPATVQTIYGLSGSAAEEYALAGGLTFVPIDISDISICVPPFVSPYLDFTISVEYACAFPCHAKVELIKNGNRVCEARSADGHSVTLRATEGGLYDYRVTVSGQAISAERFFEGETQVYESVRLISPIPTLSPGDSFCPIDETEDRVIAAITSDKDGLSISGTTVTARETGTYTLTITALQDGETVFTECTVNVVSPVEKLLPGEDEVHLNIGESFTLSPVLIPEGSGDGTITYMSSDPTVAEVSESGVITAVGRGSAIITLSAFGAEAQVYVTVLLPTEALTIIAPFDTSSMLTGTKARLYYEIEPAEADNVYAYWTSSNPEVARIDPATGFIEAMSAGTTVITAKAEDGSGACGSIYINVLQGIEELSLILPETLYPGDYATASVLYDPAGAFGADFVLTSSNPSVLAVSSDGLMTALHPGKATVTVSAEGGRTASKEVRVCAKAETLTCLIPYLTLTKGTSRTLSDIILYTPDFTNTDNLSYTTSNPEIVTVDGGILRAIGVGNAEITVTLDRLSVALPVTVTTAKAPSLSVVPSYKVLTTGESCVLNANQNVIWYCDNPEAVELISTGKSVTVKADRTANVHVYAIDAYGSVAACEIQINPVFINDITFETAFLSLTPGSEAEIKYTVSPANATEGALNWYSTDENVCEVTDGRVLATGAGECIVWAVSASGIMQSCSVSVSTVPMADARLEEDSISLFAGESCDITYIFSPADATPARFDWSTDCDVCSVDCNTVTALCAGTCVITGTAVDGSGITLMLTVHVEEIPLRAVIPAKDEITLNGGETYYIDYTVYPMNASFGEARFVSSDERVAVVDGNGLVTAVGSGSCVIYLTAGAGEYEQTAEINMQVRCGETVYRSLIMGQFTVPGISNYLPFSTNGTGAVRSALSESAGGDAVYSETNYLGASPSRETVAEVLKHFSSVADEDDVTVIYMLTHGYYTTSDGYYMGTTSGSIIKGTTLIDAVTQIPGHVVLVICSCNSGEIFRNSKLQAVMSAGGAYTAPRGSGHLSVITSTTEGSSSFYNAASASDSYDFFSRAFTQGLGWNMIAGGPSGMLADKNGDGSVTVSEIASYVPYRTQYLISSFRQLNGDRQFWGNVNQYPKYFIASGDSEIKIVSAVR